MEFIQVNEPLLSGRERKYVDEALVTGWISSEGKFVDEFETQFAKRVHREFGIAVANGSAALDVAVAALGLGDGDEVIMPSHTIISCASAIVRAGATPVLVDSDPLTWNMKVEDIKAKISPRTKAIMVVHIYCLPVDMDPVLKLAKEHGLLVLEDAAQMIGQTYKDKPCGSFGDISVFSFYPNKHITTGEGGMVVTNRKDLADRSRSFKNLCFLPHQRFIHEELGWNYRMTNLQAALGLAQLESLDQHLKIKREIGEVYLSALSHIRGITLPPKDQSYAKNIFWVFGVMLPAEAKISAADVMKLMAEKGVGTRPFFWPMHEQPVFKKMGLFANESYPFAERMARKGFYLPSGLGTGVGKAAKSAEILLKVLGGLGIS